MATLSTSNSYADYTDYVEYCDLTGQTPADQTVVEPALIRATLDIDRRYGGRFLGRKSSPTQPLAWPRVGSSQKTVNLPDGFYTTDNDGNFRDFGTTPVEVIQATCETATALLDGTSLIVQDNPTVTEETVKVDVISTTTKYSTAYQTKPTTTYLVDIILRPLITAPVVSVKFVV